MKCYFCDKEACCKVGNSKGNILRALLGGKCWEKTEWYLCNRCHEIYKRIRSRTNNFHKIEEDLMLFRNQELRKHKRM